MAVDKAETKRRLRRFEQACRRHGLRMTHQRTEIFRVLAQTDEHPDAETVYRRVHRRIPAMSLDTVYRTLGLLEAQGLVRKAESLSGPARYDANTDSHHHFVCTVCGLMKDFYSKALDDLPIPRCVGLFGHVETAQVQLRGICALCANRKHTNRRRSPV